MSKTSVFGIVKSYTQAEQIVENLQSAGFAASEISVLLPDNQGKHDFGHVKATKAPEGATAGAATGGVTGGVIGLLAGIGALAIPGVGPFIAAGPIMAALSGAAIGATTGGLAGGLIGMGIPEIEAKRYEGKLKTGNYLSRFTLMTAMKRIARKRSLRMPVQKISRLPRCRRPPLKLPLKLNLNFPFIWLCPVPQVRGISLSQEGSCPKRKKIVVSKLFKMLIVYSFQWPN